MPFFEVMTVCPLHRKNVYIRVEADHALEAIEKVVGMVIDCPWGRIDARGHRFTVERRDIGDVTPLPWIPASIVSSAPGLTPLTPVLSTPLETLYYISPNLRERQLKKPLWWKR